MAQFTAWLQAFATARCTGCTPPIHCSVLRLGHLHGKNVRADKIVLKNGVKYYLTSCDQVDNKLTEIEL